VDRSRLVWLLFVALLLVLVVNPLARLFWVSFQDPDTGALTLANYLTAFGRWRYIEALVNSLVVGLAATALAAAAGSGLGLLAGFVGRWVDQVVMRSIDTLMAFPYFLLAIAIIATLGPGLVNGMVAVAIVNIPFYGRIVRATVLAVKQTEYVEAARALGLSELRLSLSHVLRNCLAPLIVAITLNVGGMITALAGLSFLGLGVQPPHASIGLMISTAIGVLGMPGMTAYVGLLAGLAFAIVLVYLLIVVNFQSWLDPFIMISALPAALAGIAWFLFITHTTLSVPALMGAIMCMGVATSNSILVVSFATEKMAEGIDSVSAALEAGFTRFRPVLMTALAMIIGMVPMALGLGDGGEQNAPLGRAVIGGLIFATASTLLFVPAFFSVLQGKRRQSAQVEKAH